MKIVLSGIETNNKGAELMLYAILQEIEWRFPDAAVYVPFHAIRQGLGYVKTPLDLRHKPRHWATRIHLAGILRRLHLPYLQFSDAHPVPGADYFIDASGFAFSDQWHPNDFNVAFWEYLLRGYRNQGTKILFLPQAFGPVEEPGTKRLVGLLNEYADMIMPREQVSYDYLAKSGVSKEKLRLYTDFTSLVSGVFPERYGHLKNGVCVIPNMRMIDKGVISLDDYVNLLSDIIKTAEDKGLRTYLLNHEGPDDERLAHLCRRSLGYEIEVVSGLNALEVKGLIASSYMCVTSRFHGVASALNSCVPCLATSWSHKYQELYRDYRLMDCVLNLADKNSVLKKVSEYLEQSNNESIRKHLEQRKNGIQSQTREMWEAVWV